jgi:hypothetical protein
VRKRSQESSPKANTFFQASKSDSIFPRSQHWHFPCPVASASEQVLARNCRSDSLNEQPMINMYFCLL